MAKDFTQIKIEGLRDLTRSLKALDAESAKQVKDVLNDAARIVVNVAQRNVPVVTGAARASIEVRSTLRESRVRVGGKKAPYYPWLDYGGRTGRGRTGAKTGSVVRSFERHGRYLYPAYWSQHDNITRLLEKRLGAIITAAGLEPDDPA